MSEEMVLTEDMKKVIKKSLIEGSKQISAELEIIDKEIARLARGDRRSGDIADKTQGHDDINILNARRSLKIAEFNQYEDAIGRFSSEDFGICEDEDCGESISIARLQSRPTARLCVNCQEKKEQSDKNHARSGPSVGIYA